MDQLRGKPVSLTVGIILLSVFLSYQTKVIKKLPCQNNLLTNASRDFIHVDFYHLLINLLGLYYVSDLERQIGSIKFAVLIALIVSISAPTTWIVTRTLKTRCSIGFSGVLLGLIAYALITRREQLSWQPILYLIAVSVFPGASNISVSGHLIGIFAGIIAGILMQGLKLNNHLN